MSEKRIDNGMYTDPELVEVLFKHARSLSSYMEDRERITIWREGNNVGVRVDMVEKEEGGNDERDQVQREK